MVEADPSLSYPEACIRSAAEIGRTLPRRFIEMLRQEESDLADERAARINDEIRRAQQRLNWRNRGRNAPGVRRADRLIAVWLSPPLSP